VTVSTAFGAPFEFTSAKLVENYNEPDELSIVGRTDSLRAALEPGYGVLLYDDRGQMRFSGPLTKVKKRGDGYTELSYMSDLVWLWCRKCYPVPSADWATGCSRPRSRMLSQGRLRLACCRW
jgi:hypothetical protein